LCTLRCLELSCLGLCHHLYSCDCADEVALCKHIHKVHSIGTKDLNYSTVKEDVKEEELKEDYSPFPELFHQQKSEEKENPKPKKSEREKFDANIAYLINLVDQPSIQALRIKMVNSQLSDIIRQCEAMSLLENQNFKPFKGEKEELIFPNQKLEKQPRFIKSAKRKTKSMPAFPSTERRKQVKLIRTIKGIYFLRTNFWNIY